FDFKKWDDWVAKVTPDSDFRIRSMPEFKISATEGLWYDHSIESNPSNLTATDFPDIYTTKGWVRDNRSKGVFMKELKMMLPEDFLGADDQQVSVNFNNLFFDDHGLSTVINAKDVVSAGKLGDWYFSIDQIYIAVVANNPTSDMHMDGKLGLPI